MHPEYSEVIFTRCRNGMDITNNGRPSGKEGFFVYTCTSSLLNDSESDLPLINSVVAAQQPFADPALMDDAYIYATPDQGPAILLDFHPMPHDTTTVGSYDRRPGNYLTHALIGDFSDLYPFELFGNPSVWTARSRQPGYYYLTEPAPLPPRKDIATAPTTPTPGQIRPADVAAFIADGRKEALKSAVAFLISQFGQPPEARKFLAIRDASEDLIERWIAAIEFAFSPRIAAGVAFATRLGNSRVSFETANTYYVRPDGRYAGASSSGSSAHKRLRAMIVGLDERDRATAGVRVMPNGSFVLLDGKAKKALFETDTSDPYYALITRFDATHADFTRDFLQMIDLKSPTGDLLQLARAHATLSDPRSLHDVRAVLTAANALSVYPLYTTARLVGLCDQIAAQVPTYLQQDVIAAMRIMSWLSGLARAREDSTVSPRFTEMVRERLEAQIYHGDDPRSALSVWNTIKGTDFAPAVAKDITDPVLINRHGSQGRLPTSMVAAFAQIYLESAALTRAAAPAHITTMTGAGLRACHSLGDTASSQAIMAALAQVPSVNAQAILLQVADGRDPAFDQYIMGMIVAQDPSLIAPTAPIAPTLDTLKAAGRPHLIGAFLRHRLGNVQTPVEMSQALSLIQKTLSKDEAALSAAYGVLDSRLVLLDKRYVDLAIMIQEGRPASAPCPVSAHIYALHVLGDRRARTEAFTVLSSVVPQGFPSIDSPEYAQELVHRLASCDTLTTDQWVQIIGWFAHSSTYATPLAVDIVSTTTARNPDLWNLLVGVSASKPNNLVLYTAIVDACVGLRQGEKALSHLEELLQATRARTHFQSMSADAARQIQSSRPQGLFSRQRRP